MMNSFNIDDYGNNHQGYYTSRQNRSHTDKSGLHTDGGSATSIESSSINAQRRKTVVSIPTNVKFNIDSAQRAAIVAKDDFHHNISRCLKDPNGFVEPRWVPDLESIQCSSCRINFDLLLRRHHCRHCGGVFCGKCCSEQYMLPENFGNRDPQRVCTNCAKTIEPLQEYLSTNFANHARNNPVEIEPESCSARRYLNLPFSKTLGSEIRKATYSIQNLIAFSRSSFPDNHVPLHLIQQAKGIAFLTVAKIGFVFAGRVGTGLVIARTHTGEWSAPSAIATIGLSWGAQIGADLTDYVIILSDNDAVKPFTGFGQAIVGAEVDVAVGTFGRVGMAEVNIGDGGVSSSYSYSFSKGLFAGISIDGAILVPRPDVNLRFYGRTITPAQILSGGVPPPYAAKSLYDALQLASPPRSQISMAS